LEDVLNERLHKNPICFIYCGPSLFNENTYILQGKLAECAKSTDVNTSYRSRMKCLTWRSFMFKMNGRLFDLKHVWLWDGMGESFHLKKFSCIRFSTSTRFNTKCCGGTWCPSDYSTLFFMYTDFGFKTT